MRWTRPEREGKSDASEGAEGSELPECAMKRRREKGQYAEKGWKSTGKGQKKDRKRTKKV